MTNFIRATIFFNDINLFFEQNLPLEICEVIGLYCLECPHKLPEKTTKYCLYKINPYVDVLKIKNTKREINYKYLEIYPNFHTYYVSHAPPYKVDYDQSIIEQSPCMSSLSRIITLRDKVKNKFYKSCFNDCIYLESQKGYVKVKYVRPPII